jgi:hypothetical protein
MPSGHPPCRHTFDIIGMSCYMGMDTLVPIQYWIQHSSLQKKSVNTPDDDPVWPKHVINMYRNMDKVVFYQQAMKCCIYRAIYIYIVTCCVYNATVTSHHIRYSEFIAHSLVHLHNSQFHNYCHWQYHNYFSSFHSLRRMLDCNWLRWLLHFNWLITLSVVTGSIITDCPSPSHIVTDGQSVSKSCVLGLMTRYLLLFGIYGLVGVGRPLWRENGFAFCICCWPLPVQSFSGLSPLRLETIFYCLRFETSIFVTSFDSQGHGGGIWPHLHTGIEL